MLIMRMNECAHSHLLESMQLFRDESNKLDQLNGWICLMDVTAGSSAIAGQPHTREERHLVYGTYLSC